MPCVFFTLLYRRLRIVASNVALCVRLEGNIEGNIGIVALYVALFVLPEGNKSLTTAFAIRLIR